MDKIKRTVCENCEFRLKPNGCDGCLVSIAYDCADERAERVYRKSAFEFGTRTRYPSPLSKLYLRKIRRR